MHNLKRSSDINCWCVCFFSAVHVAKFLVDGFHAVSGSDDTSVRCWDISTGCNVAVFKEHQVKLLFTRFFYTIQLNMHSGFVVVFFFSCYPCPWRVHYWSILAWGCMVPTTDDIQHNICESEKLQGAAFEHQTFGLVNDFQFTNVHSGKGISPKLPRKTGSFCQEPSNLPLMGSQWNCGNYLALNLRLERNSQSKKSDKLMSPEFCLVFARLPQKPEDSGYEIVSCCSWLHQL